MLYELYHIIIFLIECTHPLVLKSLTPAGDIVVKVMLQARVLWAALSLDLHARIKTVGARTSSSPSGCSRSTFRSILCMACQCELSLTTTRRQRWSSEAALPSIQEFVDTMLMVASGSWCTRPPAALLLGCLLAELPTAACTCKQNQSADREQLLAAAHMHTHKPDNQKPTQAKLPTAQSPVKG